MLITNTDKYVLILPSTTSSCVYVCVVHVSVCVCDLSVCMCLCLSVCLSLLLVDIETVHCAEKTC